MRTQRVLKTPLGCLLIEASDRGLTCVNWISESEYNSQKKLKNSVESKILDTAESQLREYSLGIRKTFDLVLDPRLGTSFQKSVWKALLSVPYGAVVSYSEIAKMVGSPKAARAVGLANGQNPWCVVVPCHRVVRASGDIGGYSGGVAYKKKLLKLEAAPRYNKTN